VIEVVGLSKRYTIAKRDPGFLGAIKGLFRRKYIDKVAVNDIAFNIKQGEMVGYIGANGAGKSSTIKMLCGILKPTSGEIRINGIVPYKNRQVIAKQIGAVFGQRTQLFWDIPVRESYNLLRHIYQIPNFQYRQNLDWFCDVLHLDPLLDTPVRQLSLGQKMRCELAAAFLHNPSVVFLDEPTIGLDVSVKTKIRNFIKETNRVWGTTVILTTHDMQDIEEISQRIIIIDEGSILYQGDHETLQDKFGKRHRISFELEISNGFQLPESLNDLTEYFFDEENPSEVTVSFRPQDISKTDIISAVINQYKVHDFTIFPPKIETIVREIAEVKEKKNEKVF
jgi:ABC-2 type transport system ATP-binding protein